MCYSKLDAFPVAGVFFALTTIALTGIAMLNIAEKVEIRDNLIQAEATIARLESAQDKHRSMLKLDRGDSVYRFEVTEFYAIKRGVCNDCHGV